MASSPITIVGAGAWGTALAVSLGERGLPARLWARDAEAARSLRTTRENRVHLPGVPLPPAVEPTGDVREALDGAELVTFAVPSPFARSVYERLAPELAAQVPFVILTKGIEESTRSLPLDVARATLGRERPLAVLSGPSFAADVALGLPTAVVAASDSSEWSRRVQEVFSGRGLRVYTNDDPIGVQVAGAVKNVIAIAAGAAAGSGLGESVVAALVTRGLAEMRRLGEVMGASASTFAGLAGLGDLVLTCSGARSRNRLVGEAIGRGERLESVLARTRAVPEGVRTARAVAALAREYGVDMPIAHEVHRLLHEGATPAESLERLMSRPLRPEEPIPGETKH